MTARPPVLRMTLLHRALAAARPFALLLAPLLAPRALAAQYLAVPPAPGGAVHLQVPRLSVPEVSGRLRAFGGDSVVLAMSGDRAVLRLPLSQVQRVDVDIGRDRPLSALRGAGIGLVGGGLLGTTLLGEDDGLARFIGSIVGAGMGFVLGAGVGVIVAPQRTRTAWAPTTAVTDGGSDTGLAGYRLTLQPGTDLRVSAGDTTLAPAGGRAARVDGDTLVWVPEGGVAPQRVALTSLAALRIRGGRDRRRGALIGGVALGVVTGAAAAVDYGGRNISAGDAIGSTIGNVGLGALLGAWLAPQGWLRVPLPRR